MTPGLPRLGPRCIRLVTVRWRFKNFWADDERSYKGINAQYEDGDGQWFEVQFHTPESFDTKQRSHADYEIFRDAGRSKAERVAARERMDEPFARVPNPVGAADIAAVPGAFLSSIDFPVV